jgi:hypothetical protein
VPREVAKPAWVKAEELFLEKGCADWHMIALNETEISGRVADGNITPLTLSVITTFGQGNNWTTALKKIIWGGSGNSFKPVRYSNVHLQYPLLAMPLYNHRGMIESRFKVTVDEFLISTILDANKTLQEAGGVTWKIKTRDIHDIDNYFEVRTF